MAPETPTSPPRIPALVPQEPSPFTAPPPWNERTSDPKDFVFAQMITSGPRNGAHVGLLGVPFDATVIGRPGARAGPAAIRQQLATLKPFTFQDGGFEIDVADWGDVRVTGKSVPDAHRAVERAARQIAESGAIPLCLGGDHSLADPLIRGNTGPDTKLGVINLDAHLDMREAEYVTSGSPFRLLLDDSRIDSRNLVQVGIREFATSAHYGKRALDDGVLVMTPDDVAESGLATTVEKALARALDGPRRFYLSIDMDVLDAAYAPGVSAPTPGGFTTRELMTLTRLLAASGKVAGACIVETAPSLDDRDGRTSRAAAYTAMAFLAGLGEARYARRSRRETEVGPRG